MKKENVLCGERHENQIEGYSENIKSKNIIKFSYVGTDFTLSAINSNDKVTIGCSGGGKSNIRDGSLFGIKYDTNDTSIFKLLQEVIDNNNETKGNGHTTYVDGLPGGLGDTLNVEYDSGEKIYKSSNQNLIVSNESSQSFYNIFNKFVKKEGYDFNTKGSNVKLYDDADEEYLQGTWKGTHFGSEVVATFNKNHVTITIDGKITDDNVEYVIFEGKVKLNELKDGIDEAKSEHDYKEFKEVKCFIKKNYFTLSTYFYKNGSSSCELMNFKKDNPEVDGKESNNKKIFIYYSLTGNGDEVSEVFKKYGYDIKKIEVKKPLPKKFFFRIMTGGFKALIGYKEKIINFDIDINKYDKVVIGSPIWNDRICTPIRTLLKKINYNNLDFILYSGSGKGEKAKEYLNEKYPNAKIVLVKEPKKYNNELEKIMKLLNN